MTKIFPVIMCGGAGTRMWPLSRRAKPKQFHALATDKSLLQDTINRLGHHLNREVAAPSFVCAASDEAMIREQCAAENVVPHVIVLEPMGRNTAPVAAIISQIIGGEDPTALILLLPADHYIEDARGFWDNVEKGVSAAVDGYLTTFGIHPTHPETGYGYIQSGESIRPDVYAVSAFVEKPDEDTAKSYLADGSYYWNAGIFLFSASTMLDAFQAHAADIFAHSSTALNEAKVHGDAIWLDPSAFAACRSDSIDYAIMENAGKVAVIAPVDIGWNDIGSWAAVRDIASQKGGTDGDVIAIDCHNSYIRSDGPLVTAVGLDDIIVVATHDAVLVMPASRAQDVKQVVNTLKTSDRDAQL